MQLVGEGDGDGVMVGGRACAIHVVTLAVSVHCGLVALHCEGDSSGGCTVSNTRTGIRRGGNRVRRIVGIDIESAAGRGPVESSRR